MLKKTSPTCAHLAIVAIETSSEQASVALLINQQLTQRTTTGVTTHSQSILPMLQELLQEAGIGLANCSAIAFGSGPGSFTGVRTACGVVQGLAFGADLPVIPIVTLLALAETCRYTHGATDVVCALDARMGEIYWAQYHFDLDQQRWGTVIAPVLTAPALLLPQMVDGMCLIGNGFVAYRDKFSLSPELIATAEPAFPQADAVARLALIECAAGRAFSAEQAQPLYLRNKIALTIAERAEQSALAANAAQLKQTALSE